MDTQNWFGEHAGTIRFIAFGGAIVLGVIILLDVLTQKQKAATTAATATPATGSMPAGSGVLSPGYENISVFEDYSTRQTNSNNTSTSLANANNTTGATASTVTSNQYAAAPVGPVPPTHTPIADQGGPVPVPAPHPATRTYTVQPGDSLWKIAAANLGSGYNWTELYNWNRSTVGGNPNLIYPGEVLQLQA